MKATEFVLTPKPLRILLFDNLREVRIARFGSEGGRKTARFPMESDR